MKHRYFILFFAFLVVWVMAGRQLMPTEPVRAREDEPTQNSVSAPAPSTEEAMRRQHAAYEQETKERIAALQHLEEDRRLKAEAARNRDFMRKSLIASTNSAWSTFVRSNRETFIELRFEAQHNPKKEARCTICNGLGDVDYCAVCGHSGKCVTCEGTGKLLDTKYCPTCGGTGKCFFCGGSGKMMCPFCDDGIITLRAAPLPRVTTRREGLE